MKSMIKTGCVVAVAAWAFGAQAALINVGDSLTINGDIATKPYLLATIGEVNNGQGGPANEWAYSGAFAVNVVNNTPSHAGTGTILTFCTDVGVNWQYGNQAYTAFAFANQHGVNPTWSAVPAAIENASYIYNNIFLPLAANGFTGPNALTANEAAGVQLAIWKVLYDTSSGGGLSSTSFTAGNLRVANFDATTMADAGIYVNDVVAARATAGTFPHYSDTWLKPNLNNSQGLLYNNTTPASYVVPVPEPTTMLAGALLLLPLAASTFRILRRKVLV